MRIAEVEHRLDIYRSRERKFLAYYSEDYRSRFQAKLNDGSGLQIVPVWELPYILNEGVNAEHEKVTTDGVIKQFSSVLGISEEVYKVVAIILLPEHSEPNDTRQGYYEEIIVSWLDKRDLAITEKKGKVGKITVAVGGNTSSYVDIQLAEKYQFESPPYPDTIEKNKQQKQISKDEDYTTILDDKRHYIFRFRRGLSGQVVINWKIGLEKMLLTWIRLGFIIGIGTIAFSVLAAALYEEPFVLGTPIILGSLAALVGFRILLFEDIDLLEEWSWIYIILIIVNAAILAYLGVTEVIFHKPEQEVVSRFI